jgi:hypothetical protein
MIKHDDENEFTFPFSTCERPNEIGIAQPYSFLVNIVSIIIILYFLMKTTKSYNFYLILSLLAFESVHTFSHFIHLSNTLQVNLIHPMVYFVNLFYILVLKEYSGVAPSSFFIFFLVCLVCIDVYFFMFLPFVYSFSSSFVIFFSILVYYYQYLSKTDKSYLQKIILLGKYRNPYPTSSVCY